MMPQKLSPLTLFALLFLLAACTHNGTTPSPESDPYNTLLQGSWWQVERLGSNQRQSRWQKTKPSTPARFRPWMQFSMPDKLAINILHPTDRHYAARGTYTLRDNKLTLNYPLSNNPAIEIPSRLGQQRQRKLTILELDENTLLLQEQP